MGFLTNTTKGRGIVINSDYMKIIVASYYRYIRGYAYTCTEFKNMDVCASDGKVLIEVECKISKADLKNELKSSTKIKKHKYYSEGKIKTKPIPNKYYIAITEDMSKDKECFDIINSINSDYGIIIVKGFRPIDFIIKKHAKKLHANNISEKNKLYIVKRCSSESISLRKKVYDLKQKNSAE